MTTSSLQEGLARLPPELVDHILSFAGLGVCVAVRHLPSLRSLLREYTTRGNYSIVFERQLLQDLLEAGWSAGVQLYVDHDLPGSNDPTHEYDKSEYFKDEPPLCWDRVTLPVTTLEQLEDRWDVDVVPMDVLTYNLFASGATGDAMSQWMSKRVKMLGGQLVKRGANIDRLREVRQRFKSDKDDRPLASTLLPYAARHGRMDLVVFWDGLYPELLRSDDVVLWQAVEGGHMDMVQYAYERRPHLQRVLFDIAARNGHESVAWWLFDRSPRTVSCTLALDLARHSCADLLEFLNAGRHLELPTPDYDDVWQYWSDAAGKAGSQSNNHKVWRTLVDWFQRAGGCLRFYEAGQFISIESIKWLIEHNGSSVEDFITVVAAAGRDDVVKWMFADYPPFTDPCSIQEAFAGGHFELGQRMACEMGVSLSACCPTSDQLQRTVRGGRLDVLQWIDKHCGSLLCTRTLLKEAIKSRNLGIVQLLHERNPDIAITPTMLQRACEGCNLALVRWVYRRLSTTDDWAYELVLKCFPDAEWLPHSTGL
ncbi:hypothetical protein RI367_007293 [Sorochytrium milnesiophthora]